MLAILKEDNRLTKNIAIKRRVTQGCTLSLSLLELHSKVIFKKLVLTVYRDRERKGGRDRERERETGVTIKNDMNESFTKLLDSNWQKKMKQKYVHLEKLKFRSFHSQIG